MSTETIIEQVEDAPEPATSPHDKLYIDAESTIIPFSVMDAATRLTPLTTKDYRKIGIEIEVSMPDPNPLEHANFRLKATNGYAAAQITGTFQAYESRTLTKFEMASAAWVLDPTRLKALVALAKRQTHKSMWHQTQFRITNVDCRMPRALTEPDPDRPGKAKPQFNEGGGRLYEWLAPHQYGVRVELLEQHTGAVIASEMHVEWKAYSKVLTDLFRTVPAVEDLPKMTKAELEEAWQRVDKHGYTRADKSIRRTKADLIKIIEGIMRSWGEPKVLGAEAMKVLLATAPEGTHFKTEWRGGNPAIVRPTNAPRSGLTWVGAVQPISS